MFKLRIALLTIASLLAGCGEVVVFGHVMGEQHSGSEVKAAAAPQADKLASTEVAPSPVAHVVKTVTLTVAAPTQAKVTADARFSTDALLDAIKSELRARKLLDEADANAGGTADISIDTFAVEPASNAVFLGYIISNGALSGELRVHDAGGADMQTQHIEAQSKLSIPAKGDSKNPLGPLYRRFAVMTADSLAGVPSTKPDAVNNQLYR